MSGSNIVFAADAMLYESGRVAAGLDILVTEVYLYLGGVWQLSSV